MATQSLLQIWNPVTKQYESVEGEDGAINVSATIAGGDVATETTLAAVETAVDGLETLATAGNASLDAIEGSVVTTESRSISIGAAVSATVKSGAGKVFSVAFGNASGSTTLYGWLFDNTTASGTSIVPPVPLAPGAYVVLGTDLFTEDGNAFTTGLTWGFSTSRTTYSAHVTAGDCQFGAFYS